MKKTIAIALFLLYFGSLAAQTGTQRAVLSFGSLSLQQVALTEAEGQVICQASIQGEIPFQKIGPFIACSVVWYASAWEENADELAAFFQDEKGQTTVLNLTSDPHANPLPGRYISRLQFLENGERKFQISFRGRSKVEKIEIHFFDPGNTPGAFPPDGVFYEKNLEENSARTPLNMRSDCSCPLPDYQNRADWCPDGDCQPVSTPSPTTVTHLIVHHAAGTNVATDWAAVVRSYWDFHVHVNGWNDIGYNWLIDPNGVLYEGRGNDILGAHFCGKNGGTMGVCMLGDYTAIQPTNLALKALSKLLAWKCCDRDLEPLDSAYHSSSGLVLPRISGHRDGCSTSCPGDAFYPTLPVLRTSVWAYTNNGCEFPQLEAPSLLAVHEVSFNRVNLSWQDNSDYEGGYLLERSVDSNDNFTALVLLPPNSASYSDLSVAPATGYFYRVKAFDIASSSPYSNEVFALTDEVSGSSSAPTKEEAFRLFPNPTSGHFTISIENKEPGKVEVRIFDALNRLVHNSSAQKANAPFSMDVDISSLPPGVFWVSVLQSKRAKTIRVVKGKLF